MHIIGVKKKECVNKTVAKDFFRCAAKDKNCTHRMSERENCKRWKMVLVIFLLFCEGEFLIVRHGFHRYNTFNKRARKVLLYIEKLNRMKSSKVVYKRSRENKVWRE